MRKLRWQTGQEEERQEQGQRDLGSPRGTELQGRPKGGAGLTWKKTTSHLPCTGPGISAHRLQSRAGGFTHPSPSPSSTSRATPASPLPGPQPSGSEGASGQERDRGWRLWEIRGTLLPTPQPGARPSRRTGRAASGMEARVGAAQRPGLDHSALELPLRGRSGLGHGLPQSCEGTDDTRQTGRWHPPSPPPS